MAENIYSCFHYHKKCQEDRQAIEELAPKIMEAASNVAWGNVGDIKYTARTDVPNGGVWCDGAAYAKEDYPDVYKLLTDGKLVSVDMTTFDSSVNLNGSCGFFGLDTSNESFKVPMLKDVYLKAGQDGEMFGAESLPNITGTFYGYQMGLTGGSGAFYDGNNPYGGAGSGSLNNEMNFSASRSSSAYQDGAKVNPDHVKYRAYVVLFLAEKELSIVNWTNQLQSKTDASINQIEAKTDNTLAEIDAKAKSIEAPVGALMPFAGNTAPSGWLKCDGSAVSRTTYANLFAVIGTTYGAGDGSTTFNVPNYSNARFVTSATVAVKGNGKALGLTVGSEGLHLGSGESGLFPFSGGSYNLGTRDGSAYRTANNVGVSTNASNSGITGSVSLASACNFIIKH